MSDADELREMQLAHRKNVEVIRDRLRQTEEQRDELLAACEAIWDSVKPSEPSTIPGPVFAKVLTALHHVRGQ